MTKVTFTPEELSLMEFLKNEVHPALNAQQMRSIGQHRAKLAYKSQDESERLLYEWTKTGKLTRLEHTLLCRYVFQKA